MRSSGHGTRGAGLPVCGAPGVRLRSAASWQGGERCVHGAVPEQGRGAAGELWSLRGKDAEDSPVRSGAIRCLAEPAGMDGAGSSRGAGAERRMLPPAAIGGKEGAGKRWPGLTWLIHFMNETDFFFFFSLSLAISQLGKVGEPFSARTG